MAELHHFEVTPLRRLKSDPVPEEIITRVLDAAIRAPSAGNAQNWIFIVVRDAEQRRRLGAIYRKASDIASEIYRARGPCLRDRVLPPREAGTSSTGASPMWPHR